MHKYLENRIKMHIWITFLNVCVNLLLKIHAKYLEGEKEGGVIFFFVKFFVLILYYLKQNQPRFFLLLSIKNTLKNLPLVVKYALCYYAIGKKICLVKTIPFHRLYIFQYPKKWQLKKQIFVQNNEFDIPSLRCVQDTRPFIANG